MSETPFDVGAGDSLLQLLPFRCLSVIVNNAGGQWIRFPDTGDYVPPYFVGAVVALPGPVDLARVDTVPPAGQVNTGTGTKARLRFSTEEYAPQPGTNIAGLSQGTTQAQHIVIVNTPGNAQAGSISFNLDVVPKGTWRIASIYVALLTNVANQAGYPQVACSLGYGAFSPLAAGKATIEEGTVGSPSRGALAWHVVPPKDGRPQIVADGTTQLVLTCLSADGSLFPVNGVLIVVDIVIVPVVL